jgi:hypothetical protein
MTVSSNTVTDAVKGILLETALFGLAILLTIIASFFLAPLRVNPLLYIEENGANEVISDMSQAGWPLPFMSSYTVEWSNKSSPVNRYDVASALVDIIFLYCLIQLTKLSLRKIFELINRK